ncbi:MAG: protein translocase subunit SecF [Acidobacteriota bacterium]|nr:MAG: protein translocase subunit SecF [Acidobacteriota bacterium]
MRIIGDTNIDFMRVRWVWVSISVVLVALSIAVLVTRGINRGVEFAGGAEVILRFVEPPDLNEVRGRLADAGLPGVSVTTSTLTADTIRTAFEGTVAGVVGEDLIIRVALPDEVEEGGDPLSGRDLTTRITNALRGAEVRANLEAGKLDLNVTDETSLTRVLREGAGLDDAEAAAAARLVVDWRRTHGGLFNNLEQLAELDLSEQATRYLREQSFVGPFALRGQEFIEASISAEMRNKAFGAILGALGGMLLYIWIRFQFQWGLGAIVAVAHDAVLTLGAFSLVGMEANLPVVAAFLTLVGYSVNDTIVVFDRVRENMGQRGTGKLEHVINGSINQCLSRTLITSLTTWIVVASLFLFGGPVIRPFAFVLLIGIVIGTYSSIYVASPVLLLWQSIFRREPAAKGAAERARKRAVRRAH